MKILLIILVIFTLNNETARASTQTVSKIHINNSYMNSETKIQKEAWKDIEGYEGLYQISNFGNVKSLEKYVNHSSGCGTRTVNERILKPSFNSKGYLIVGLFINGKQKKRTIHQLVAVAFKNHIPNGHILVVNHKDFNKLNNRVKNLEIVTQRENTNQKHLKSSSIYTGVSWRKDCNKWNAKIRIKGKTKHLGYFTIDNELDASNAYQNALKELL